MPSLPENPRRNLSAAAEAAEPREPREAPSKCGSMFFWSSDATKEEEEDVEEVVVEKKSSESASESESKEQSQLQLVLQFLLRHNLRGTHRELVRAIREGAKRDSPDIEGSEEKCTKLQTVEGGEEGWLSWDLTVDVGLKIKLWSLDFKKDFLMLLKLRVDCRFAIPKTVICCTRSSGRTWALILATNNAHAPPT